jgi:hypothetical protein
MYLFDRNEKPKARKLREKRRNDSQNGKARIGKRTTGIGKGTTFSRAASRRKSVRASAPEGCFLSHRNNPKPANAGAGVWVAQRFQRCD